jgi:uncharacterized damage-inducible protein DinB
VAAENEVLVRLFEHAAWANERMLEACRPLSAEQLDTITPGTYGRLGHTLIHLARAQGGYVRTLAGWQPGPEHRLEYDEPFAGIDRIAEHIASTGQMLVGIARMIEPAHVLSGTDDEGAWSLPAWVVLLQAAYHATEHRQQVATALSALGFEPPEPDLWAYWDAIKVGWQPTGEKA